MSQQNLTQGNVLKILLRFSLPYLLSCFLQTFYGLADLFITGQFNGANTITAVSVGSQVTHMLTVMIVGLAMGTTVTIGRYVGANNKSSTAKSIGNSVIIFIIFSIFMTILLLFSTNGILSLLSTPSESFLEARNYLLVCFAGVPFITAYNVISSIFRGLGDTKSPMFFVAISGIVNIGLDYLFIGPMHMGAFGAAIATIMAQALSVFLALFFMIKKGLGLHLSKQDFSIDQPIFKNILRIGLPVSLQDGLIQVAFLTITVIANRRGVNVAAAVGIVEKLIGFMFLVPSAMLSSVSALAAQNAGAGKHDRAKQTLYYAIAISVGMGILFTIICEFQAESILHLFAKEEPLVIMLGAQYLRSYVFDCVAAGGHFCFSGYFCAYQKPSISFIHNVASILLVRIPGAYFASIYFTDSLFPMGVAAPLGSLLSVIICIGFYIILKPSFV